MMRRTLLLLAPAVLVLTVSACTPGILAPTGSDAPGASTTETPPAPSDNGPGEPSVAPTTDPVGGELDVPCGDLLTLDQLYAFNPNFAATANPAIAQPARVTQVADMGGVACAYQHVTASDVLYVAAAPVTDDNRAELLRLASYERDTATGLNIAAADNERYYVVIASQYVDDQSGTTGLIEEVLNNLDAR